MRLLPVGYADCRYGCHEGGPPRSRYRTRTGQSVCLRHLFHDQGCHQNAVTGLALSHRDYRDERSRRMACRGARCWRAVLRPLSCRLPLRPKRPRPPACRVRGLSGPISRLMPATSSRWFWARQSGAGHPDRPVATGGGRVEPELGAGAGGTRPRPQLPGPTPPATRCSAGSSPGAAPRPGGGMRPGGRRRPMRGPH